MLGEKNLSEGDSKTITEEIEKYIQLKNTFTSTKCKF